MKIARRDMERLIYGDERIARRYTQDSPILPDVWIQYGRAPDEPQDLLITPHFGATAGEVAKFLRQGLGRRASDAAIAYNQTYVAARLRFEDMIRLVLPMTHWWEEQVLAAVEEITGRPRGRKERLDIGQVLSRARRASLVEILQAFEKTDATGEEEGPVVAADLLWMLRIVGAIELARTETEVGRRWWPPTRDAAALVDAIAGLLADLPKPDVPEGKPLVWQINRNRQAQTSVTLSTLAVKADAARLLFKVDCSDLAWAIIDNGVDASHPALWKWPEDPERRREERKKRDPARWREYTRVKATYDFTRIRELLDLDKLRKPDSVADERMKALLEEARKDRELRNHLQELKRRLSVGRPVDWSILAPLLEIPHDRYVRPRGEHGTHVAGILAADWPEEDMQGMCPDIRLYDFRVLRPGGANDEFAVLAALQFVSYLNGQKDFFAVHGVNMSLAIRHEVANFACGRTPVCDECQRLVASGVVVVAAAGNDGYLHYLTSREDVGGYGVVEGYHTVSITDPGNADKVITVGSTHRFQPHTYGVSYFSSRGPTGDGRIKPDLVAPGEKIEGPTPFGAKRRMDGTSMAAPHVSGAAAILMARYSEFIGQPERVKHVLCSTATDLGRERYFQGAGMLDVLRAVQSV